MSVLALVDRLSGLSAGLAGLLTIPMMFTVFLDAVLRATLGVAPPGVIELNSFLLVTMIYLGLAGAQRNRQNFRVTLVAERLPRWADLTLSALLQLLLTAILVALVIFTFNSLMFSLEREEVTYGIIQVPLWPSRLVLSLGFVLLLIQCLADTGRLLLEGRHPYAEQSANLENQTL